MNICRVPTSTVDHGVRTRKMPAAAGQHEADHDRFSWSGAAQGSCQALLSYPKLMSAGLKLGYGVVTSHHPRLFSGTQATLKTLAIMTAPCLTVLSPIIALAWGAALGARPSGDSSPAQTVQDAVEALQLEASRAGTLSEASWNQDPCWETDQSLFLVDIARRPIESFQALCTDWTKR